MLLRMPETLDGVNSLARPIPLSAFYLPNLKRKDKICISDDAKIQYGEFMRRWKMFIRRQKEFVCRRILLPIYAIVTERGS
jgi:hypothetical protein